MPDSHLNDDGELHQALRPRLPWTRPTLHPVSMVESEANHFSVFSIDAGSSS